MHLFNNFGIAKRLYLVSFILIAALATVAISGWVGLKEDARLAERVGTVRTPQLMRIAAVELNVTRVSLQIRHAILARSDVELRQTLADITEKGKLIDEALKGFEAGLLTQAERDMFDKIPPLVASFWVVGGENIGLIEAGDKEAAFEMLVSRTIPVRNQLLEVLAAEKQYQGAQLEQELSTIKQGTDNTRIQIV
ncbi:MAG: MCP four helix bundle domain-containing protein, partial [Thiobacillus sp.]